MTELTMSQMQDLSGGDRDYGDVACGLAIGAVVVGSAVGGWIGFALTINKALAACTVAALT